MTRDGEVADMGRELTGPDVREAMTHWDLGAFPTLTGGFSAGTLSFPLPAIHGNVASAKGVPRMRKNVLAASLAALVAAAATVSSVEAQSTNPRFGVWQLQSDAPPPAKNVMTYEPYGDGGMAVTVASTNARGESSEWGYVTLFDGVFRPVRGQDNADTAVEIIDENSTRILNRRSGRVYQVIINTLSEDRNTISNEYVRLDEDGKITRVTHAVYQRIG